MADIKRHRYLGIGVFIITAAVIITTTTSWLLYNHTVNLLTDNLRKRLLAIVTTAVVEIDAEDRAGVIPRGVIHMIGQYGTIRYRGSAKLVRV